MFYSLLVCASAPRLRQAITPALAAANASSTHGSPIGNSSLWSPGSPGLMKPLLGPLFALGVLSSGVGIVPVSIITEVDFMGMNATFSASAYTVLAEYALPAPFSAEVERQGNVCAARGNRLANSKPAAILIILCFMVFMFFCIH